MPPLAAFYGMERCAEDPTRSRGAAPPWVCLGRCGLRLNLAVKLPAPA